MGLGKGLITVGEAENIFHYVCHTVPDIPTLMEHLPCLDAMALQEVPND
jgi:hypothetical protein